jgi:hypothetical protein
MTAIPQGYRKALDSWLGGGGIWYPNWPLAEGHRLGELGRLHGASYVYEGPSGITFHADPAEVTLDAWTYQSARDTSVAIGVNAEAPGFSFLGSASAGIKADFGSSRAVYVSAADAQIRRVAEVAQLRHDLLSAARTRNLPRATALVAATLTAKKALVLTSLSDKTSFEATARTAPTPLPTIPADLAGNLAVVRGAASVDIQEFGSTPVVLAMRLIVLVNQGWLWWRQLDTTGVAAQSADDNLELLEILSDESDYFAIL